MPRPKYPFVCWSVKKVVEKNLEKFKGATTGVSNKDQYYKYRSVSRTADTVDHIFYIGKQVTENLRSVGLPDDMIREIRAIMSSEVFGRSGLQEAVMNLVENRVLSKLK